MARMYADPDPAHLAEHGAGGREIRLAAGMAGAGAKFLVVAGRKLDHGPPGGGGGGGVSPGAAVGSEGGPYAWHGSMVADDDGDVMEALWEHSVGIFPNFRVPWDYHHSSLRPPPGASEEDTKPYMIYPPDPEPDPLDGDSEEAPP